MRMNSVLSLGVFAMSAAMAAAQAGAAPASPAADPFPQPNPRFFTAASPSVETVDAFLKALWGFDPARIWRVEAIQKTSAPGVSRVTVFIGQRGQAAKPQSTSFLVLPDGKHVVAGDQIMDFGEKPFALNRALLQQKADGPAKGAAGKELLLVEFADMQCPHCKESETIFENLVKDFPNARVVFQNYPLVDIHPFAFKAAAMGVCIAQKNNDAFFTYLHAVYEKQEALTPETGDQTLTAAVTAAGQDPAAITACANSQPTKDKVQAQLQLGEEAGVDQTPMIAVNGHLLPLGQLPYEVLKQIVAFQASQDGISTGTTAPPSLLNK